MYKIFDIVLFLPSGALAYTQFLRWAGAQIEIPVLENIPNPIYSLLIIGMTFYWVARGIAIIGKTYGEFVEKQHSNERQRIIINREKRDEYIRQTAIYATEEQIAKINELEDKQQREKEAMLKKLGLNKGYKLKEDIE